ncbi:O-antigen ligase family protein [Hymenobacter rigui]|uniref:O-antigen ligase family protein n=1 Tax=Hymenobacter rigui TaxID=334424 RepID=A0A3R9P8K8_9BACT|nr:O-antigen ligase family protein [Hymenobacter rigui]RSK51187.1 O-antigen ligase family protein [Hymenobacter rigui]
MAFSLRSELTIPRLLVAATFFSACTIVGLFTSSFFRVLPSIGMIGMAATGLTCFLLHGQHYQRTNRSNYLPFLLIFLVHASAGVLTSSARIGEYIRDLVLQLPFLVLPLAFWLLPPLPTRNLRFLWLLLIGTTALAALLSTGNYLLHFDQINEMYLRSKVMPTEPDHIRFSLLVTLSVAAGVCLLAHRSVVGKGAMGLWALVICLAFYQHLLAVRSGLVTLYVMAVVALLWLVFRTRQYQQALLLAAGLVFVPAVSYSLFPTLRNKSANTREDMGQVDNTASANNYSLVGRVYSYKVALEVVKDNPWFGVGRADIEPEMALRYQRDYPNIRPNFYIQPHNQFLFSAVAFGLIGLVVFIVGFYYAGLSVWPRYAPLLLAQYVIVTLSFLVEYTLETQIGLGYALFFILLALEGQKPVPQPEGEWRPV